MSEFSPFLGTERWIMGRASETGQAHITAALTRAYADVVTHDRGTGDDRRMRALGEAVNGVVAASPPYRACVAADVLQVSEKTVHVGHRQESWKSLRPNPDSL